MIILLRKKGLMKRTEKKTEGNNKRKKERKKERKLRGTAPNPVLHLKITS
jgi:hypothetical protein